ncbi:Serine/threonine-protein kinase PknB [Stieleria maiorica]|uniref:non-specific serine/threonine protein kinase n=1 Tax=Stieleria maiorica TaxID=2795974 RepID=A0A5B9MEI3_9BACT|nr:serine/threonine-protein kinase [Stieleria maiorica]QEF98636.1 Serine/threonine-protein kinase PknB [Stieleria maiorica]
MTSDQPIDPPADATSHRDGETSFGEETLESSHHAEAPIPDSFFSKTSDAPPASDPDDDPVPDRIGDYDVIGTLGKGGMGIVYLARQKAANRTVALKVIRPEHLAGMTAEQRERALTRFRTEAQAAARLDHENMVTLYDVGESNGQQFLSMRYVQGRSLAEILRFGPIDNRPAATYIRQVCRALDEAHRQGILHRDLKPQNILIDAKTDRALVTDFGLAKLTEQEDGLTRDGDVMGTPQYMSPEQARDSAGVTVRSDVYAIGATLYHMLTARPVFQAATVWETLRQVMDRQPVSPRQLNPAIDLDLDTICLKCLEKDPTGRYKSAGDVADELDRYLSGVPILARPISTLGRLRRWSRRNRLIAASAATALGCLVFAFIAVSVSLVQTRSAFERSELSFKQALDAVNDFFTTVSEETLLDQPGLKPLRHDLMRQALQYYDRFLVQRANDPTIADLMGVTHYRVGLITAEIESHEAALDHFDRAIEIQRRGLEDRPQSQVGLRELANSYNARGDSLYHLGRWESSLNSFRQSKRLRQQLVELQSDSIEYRRLLANADMNLGIVFKRCGNLPAAFDALGAATELREQLSQEHPDHPSVLRDVAKGYYALGGVYAQQGMMDSARTYYDRAIDSFSQLVQMPGAIDDHYLLSGSHFARAGLLEEPAGAIEGFRRAMREMAPVAAINPNVDKYQMMLINCGFEIAFRYEQLGQIDDAASTLRSASRTAIALARRDDRSAQEVARILLELARLESSGQGETAMWIHYQRLATDALEELPQSPTLTQLVQEIDSRVESLSN